ncbi:T-lymphocyte surface antigen Ly-9 isoform X2 [Brienomyrus brachyistius]|uniref:T-lymphocyte surface antigen Ly-9 isoform X2 n=1 Tax=Brienomyrus brachyistius TaxID=42636 RepID=UPI0020B392BC|nr:T-lymphocyte surface antigen Ly-9 isoform X2 [Brienomyrus brachyistius]
MQAKCIRFSRRVPGVMALNPTWTEVLLLALLSPQCLCLTVYIQTRQPLHVIPGSSLVLKAQISKKTGEQITKVMWERDAENRAGLAKVRVAEFPGQNADPRMSVDDGGATLTVKDFREEDCGVYTISVMNQTNELHNASCLVREYTVSQVSTSINMSHPSLHCEALGTDLHFDWLHEEQTVPHELGYLSADNRVLYLSSGPCGHFTCVVSNSIGKDSASFMAESCRRQGSSTLAVTISLTVLLICVGIFTYYMWRRRSRLSNRAERLHEEHL